MRGLPPSRSKRTPAWAAILVAGALGWQPLACRRAAEQAADAAPPAARVDDLDGVTLPALIEVTGTRALFESGDSIDGLSGIADLRPRETADGRYRTVMNASSQTAIDKLRAAGFTVRVTMTSVQRKEWLRGIAARQFGGATDASPAPP